MSYANCDAPKLFDAPCKGQGASKSWAHPPVRPTACIPKQRRGGTVESFGRNAKQRGRRCAELWEALRETDGAVAEPWRNRGKPLAKREAMQMESCRTMGSLGRNRWNCCGTVAEPWEALSETQSNADGVVRNRGKP